MLVVICSGYLSFLLVHRLQPSRSQGQPLPHLTSLHAPWVFAEGVQLSEMPFQTMHLGLSSTYLRVHAEWHLFSFKEGEYPLQ